MREAYIIGGANIDIIGRSDHSLIPFDSNIGNKVKLKEYIDFRYNESLGEVEILDIDSKETAEKRKISHLTLNWFMKNRY